MVQVHYVITGFEFAEVTEKARSFRAGARPFLHRCGLEEITRAVEGQLRFRNYKSLRQGGAKQDRSRRTARGDLFHQTRACCALFELSEPVRDIVFPTEVGEPFELARTRRGDQYLFARAQASSNFPQKRGNLPVITRRGLNLKSARLRIATA